MISCFNLNISIQCQCTVLASPLSRLSAITVIQRTHTERLGPTATHKYENSRLIEQKPTRKGAAARKLESSPHKHRKSKVMRTLLEIQVSPKYASVLLVARIQATFTPIIAYRRSPASSLHTHNGDARYRDGTRWYCDDPRPATKINNVRIPCYRTSKVAPSLLL